MPRKRKIPTTKPFICSYPITEKKPRISCSVVSEDCINSSRRRKMLSSTSVFKLQRSHSTIITKIFFRNWATRTSFTNILVQDARKRILERQDPPYSTEQRSMAGNKRIVSSISTFRLVPIGSISETCSKSLAKTLMTCNLRWTQFERIQRS